MSLVLKRILHFSFFCCRLRNGDYIVDDVILTEEDESGLQPGDRVIELGVEATEVSPEQMLSTTCHHLRDILPMLETVPSYTVVVERDPAPLPALLSLSDLLERCGLPHLIPPLSAGGHTLAELHRQIESCSRAELLAHVKGIGVERLAERQKIVSGLTKALRDRQLTPSLEDGHGRSRKPRVVLLHGTNGSRKALTFQLRALLHSRSPGGLNFEHGAELIWIQGSAVVGAGHPHAADAAELRQGGAVRADDPLFTYGSHEPHGATWVLRGDRGVPGARHPIYTGWDEAVAEVEAAMRALPAPVDAIVGFSMGGNLAIEVAARAERGVSGLSPLRCIVTLEASYALNYDSQPGMSKELYATPLVTPVLLGLSAAGLPSTRNRELLGGLFRTAVVFRYDHGHRALPADLEARAAFCDAVRAFVHSPRQHRFEGGAYEYLGGHEAVDVS